MRNHLLPSINMAPSNSVSSSSLSLSKPTTFSATSHHQKKPSHPSNPNPNSTTHCSSSALCRHSPSATLDILILILVLFSGTFLITSYFSYIFQSLSLLLPTLSHSTDFLLQNSALIFLLAFAVNIFLAILLFEICCGYMSRKCEDPRCKGLKKAREFDLRIQTEECLRSAAPAVRLIDELPWKGGSETNPDYQRCRAELRKLAPPNGRAVMIYWAQCGCPVAKIEGWGAKRGRRSKKGL